MAKATDAVDLHDGATSKGTEKDDTSKTSTSEPKLTLEEQLRRNITLLETAVSLKETRLISGRLLRQTSAVRHQLTADVLTSFVSETLPAGLEPQSRLLSSLSKVSTSMDVETTDKPSSKPKTMSPAGLLPEVEAYVVLLVVLFLVDHKQQQEVREITTAAVSRLSDFNRRTLDSLFARICFYYSLAYECTGNLVDIRTQLLALHRTAVLRHDEYGQETLLNLLLRNYLHYNLYEQAEQLRSKAQRPEQSRQGTQLCRYLYYLGRIRAIQLDYTEAKDCLQQAARKAPTAAHGFRVAANKWLVLVRLLLGEVPEHVDFMQPGLQGPMQPYYELTQAVRAGDLHWFRQVTEQHDKVFAADRVQNVIVRLRHNVIRAGLKRISLAYSRISLADVAAKLGLQNVEDTEFIVAKAIRDGGVDATIDHEAGTMSSKEVVDIYSTEEPQAAFHARVAFCLDIHNEAVKAMRFEPGAHKKSLEKVQQELAISDAEIAKAIEEAEDED